MKSFTQHIIMEAKPKANGKSFKWNKEEHPPLKKGTITIQMEFMGWEKDGELASWSDEDDPKYNAKGVEKRFKLKLKFKRETRNGSMWDITGKTEDVFFYITTEYQGNSEKGNESPGSDIGVEMIKAINPNMYEGNTEEAVLKETIVPKGIYSTLKSEIDAIVKQHGGKVIEYTPYKGKPTKSAMTYNKVVPDGNYTIGHNNLKKDGKIRDAIIALLVQKGMSKKGSMVLTPKGKKAAAKFKSKNKDWLALQKAGEVESVEEGYASNDPKVKAIAKKFKKDIKDIRRGYMDVEYGTKLYEAVFEYLANSEKGNWDDADFAWDKVSDFIHDMSKFGLGKV